MDYVAYDVDEEVAEVVGVDDDQSRNPELSQIWLFLKARIWSSLKALYLVIACVTRVAYVAYDVDEEVAEVVGVDDDQSGNAEPSQIWLFLKARIWSSLKTLYLVIACVARVANIAYVVDEEVAEVEGVDDDQSGNS